MQSLNFPNFRLEERIDEQKKFIFDRVRNKIIPLTPEEWVRQHCLELINGPLNVSTNLIAIERQIILNDRPKRIDIACFDRNGKAQLLVECKAPEVKITAQTLLQIGWYNSKLDTPYLWLTNGLNHFWFQRKNESFRLIPFPEYLEL